MKWRRRWKNKQKKSLNIDIIFPYVDDSDPEWQELYNKNVATHTKDEGKKWYVNSVSSIRFSQNDMLKYLFRGIEKNVQWVNKVHMIVQSESQIPNWINRNEVNIIYHKDFIPEEYLPTFNSCTIEMFLHNIKDLSENFIYGNDDFFFISPVHISDFFIGNKLVYGINFRRHHKNWMWDELRLHCQDLIGSKTSSVMDVQHIWSPHNKTMIRDLFNKRNNKILESLSQFRKKKNYSQWLFSMYYYKRGKCINRKLPYIKSELGDKAIKNALSRNWKFYKAICLNDSLKKCTLKHLIINKFKKMFPNKCKYEK